MTYGLYARKTTRHNWRLYGKDPTPERIAFLRDCFKRDAPGWEVAVRLLDWTGGDVNEIDNQKTLPGVDSGAL